MNRYLKKAIFILFLFAYLSPSMAAMDFPILAESDNQPCLNHAGQSHQPSNFISDPSCAKHCAAFTIIVADQPMFKFQTLNRETFIESVIQLDSVIPTIYLPPPKLVS